MCCPHLNAQTDPTSWQTGVWGWLRKEVTCVQDCAWDTPTCLCGAAVIHQVRFFSLGVGRLSSESYESDANVCHTCPQTQLGNRNHLSPTLTIWRCLELEWSNSCIHTLTCPESVLYFSLKTFRIIFPLTTVNVFQEFASISLIQAHFCHQNSTSLLYISQNNFINITSFLLLWGE